MCKGVVPEELVVFGISMSLWPETVAACSEFCQCHHIFESRVCACGGVVKGYVCMGKQRNYKVSRNF